MGREVRMVPPTWKHPKDGRGQFRGLMDGFAARLAEWRAEKAKYDADPEQWKKDHHDSDFESWEGDEPQPDDYMPDFPPGTATHLMMYETCSEGTPISPAFATPEELARWLADTGASAFGGQTASYESWLAVAKGGWAPSAMYSPQTGLISGVEAMGLKQS